MSTEATAQAAPSQSQQPASPDAAAQVVPSTEFEKVRDRAYRMEGLAKDWEKKFVELETRVKGLDIDEYKTLKSEKEKLQEELAKNNPEEREKLYASREAKLRKEMADKETDLNKRLEDLQRENKTLKVTDKAMAEVGPLFHPNCQRFVKAEVERFMDFQDGQIVVKDENGVVQYSRVNPGQLMTPKEWAEEFAKQYPQMAVSTAVGGARQTATGKPSVSSAGANGSSTLPPNFSSLPKAEQQAFFRQNPEALKNFKQNFSFNT